MIRLDHRGRVPDALRGAIIALGNFDGFHLGHQAVVREAVEWARSEGRAAIVATFDPHPVRHFGPLGRPAAVAGQHDVAPVGEQPRQALEGLAAHDHRRAAGVRDEALQVLADAPRDLAVPGDGAVARPGDDESHLARLVHGRTVVTWPILRPSRASRLP